MKSVFVKAATRPFLAASLLGLIMSVATNVPASAITSELAKKCRQLAFQAHPPQRAGSKAGTAQEARKYYSNCLANEASASDDKAAKPPPASAR